MSFLGFRGTEMKALAVAFIALFFGYIAKATGAGQGIAEFGQGIQTGISSILSPKIEPTFKFVPEIGLRFGFSGLSSNGSISSNGYQNNVIAYAQNEEQRTSPTYTYTPNKIVAY